MKYTEVFKEARRLYDMGWAIHWLHPKSKRPIESGWTTGPRKPWSYLKETYIDGLNVGVRLGEPSKLAGGYLAVVDVDVKSKDPKHRREAIVAAKELLHGKDLPTVLSGRGGGSRHIYVLTREPFKTFNPAQSRDLIKVHMPSKKPSKKELAELTPKEISDGIRISHAWEVSLYSNGRQVVLPPSVHPDTGELYLWKKHVHSNGDLEVVEFALPAEDEATAKEKKDVVAALDDFAVSEVELSWLPISDDVREAIIHGTGVSDRSGYLLKAASALVSAGLTQTEVLTVLTDPTTFLGACAYEHAKTKSRKAAANWLYRYTVKRIMDERNPSNSFDAVDDQVEERQLTPEEMEAQAAEFAEIRSWRQDLEVASRGGAPKATIHNVVLILDNVLSPEVFLRNLFATRDMYGMETPWGGVKGRSITDDDIIRIKYWLGQKFGFEPKNQVIEDSIAVIALRNSYDPVKDKLDQLPPWDGKDRLSTWLVENFEAKGHPEYLGQVFRKWMVAMVMRAYNPGAKFDWMPIFEGAQGIGKSSFGRLLVGEDYFLDWLPNLADKDSALALQGMWTVEMGELSQFRKNELEVIKGFITRTVDQVRPPFGKRWIESPRRCVFFGTTNKETYLRDDTGNRRFKPVRVGSLDFAALDRDHDQLFAQAKHLWVEKIETEKTLEMTGKAKSFETEIHAEKMVEDDSNIMRELVQDFVSKPDVTDDIFDFEKFRIHDLFSGIGPLSRWRLDQRNIGLAAKALKTMGAENWKSDGRKVWRMAPRDPFKPSGTSKKSAGPCDDFF